MRAVLQVKVLTRDTSVASLAPISYEDALIARRTAELPRASLFLLRDLRLTAAQVAVNWHIEVKPEAIRQLRRQFRLTTQLSRPPVPAADRIVAKTSAHDLALLRDVSFTAQQVADAWSKPIKLSYVLYLRNRLRVIMPFPGRRARYGDASALPRRGMELLLSPQSSIQVAAQWPDPPMTSSHVRNMRKRFCTNQPTRAPHDQPDPH